MSGSPAVPGAEPQQQVESASADTEAGESTQEEAPSGEPDIVRAVLTAPVRVATVGLFALGLAVALYFSRSLVLPIFIAVLLTLLLSPLATALERIRIPRFIAAIVLVAALLTLVGFVASYMYEPAQQWLNGAPAQFDELREKIARLREPVDAVQDAAKKVAGAAQTEEQAPREVVVERRSLLGVLTSTQSYLVGILATVILLFFLLASGDMFLRKLIRVIPKFHDKIVAVEIARTIQAQIGRYFASITMINIGLGVAVALAMRALGMPTPALLGMVAGVLNFIPYIGSAITLLLVAFVSILTFDTAVGMVVPPLVYLGLTALEGQVVQPLVLGERLRMPAVVVFTWILLWGWLWGIGGVAIAVPLLVVLKICADHIPSWSPLAQFLDREVEKPK